MTDLIKAIVLGVVQGLTEFLPVSSTGHLIIFEELLGVSDDTFGLRFDAAIHLGTLAAVLVYFRSMLLPLAAGLTESVRSRRWDVSADSRLAWLLLLGTLPAGVFGFLLEDTAETTFRSPALVGAMLILFSLPMVVAERLGSRQRTVVEATPRDAVLLGLAQSIALVPGVSRSGITISAGMASGFARSEAAVFAFLLSGPIIAAAGGKQLYDILSGAGASGSGDLGVYAAGLVTAAVVGYSAIVLLVRFLRFNPLHIFVGYRVVLGGLILVLAAADVL